MSKHVHEGRDTILIFLDCVYKTQIQIQNPDQFKMFYENIYTKERTETFDNELKIKKNIYYIIL